MKAIRLVDDSEITNAAHLDLESVIGRHKELSPEEEAAEQKKLLRASKIAKYTTGAMTLILLILWPMPLYGSGYIFSPSFFAGWVIVGIIWLMCSTMAVGVYPLWEGRDSLKRNVMGMFNEVTGRRRPRGRAEVVEGQEGQTAGDASPVKESWKVENENEK